MKETTIQRLQERQDTPQVLNNSEESFNSKRSTFVSNVNSPDTTSKPLSHSGCGYNSLKQEEPRARISGHSVFVIGFDGKPLTPTTPSRARKLMKGKQAKPIWSKFSTFGIQMLVPTRKETPKTALGVDFGTKFEGYAVATGKENSLSVMWKLPDKKKIVSKLEERRILRRARRFRNCRRRECRFDNREKKGFIAPSQQVILNSRLKVISEFFRIYPITAVAMEDVKFNHRDKRWGKNFSTIEVGKKKINSWIKELAALYKYSGYETGTARDLYGYKKSKSKSSEIFNSHCSDALAIATDIFWKKHIPEGYFVVCDDTYRHVRRRLHDTQFSKGGVRYSYSTGNFRGIRKGTICGFGLISGGTGNNISILPFKAREGKEKRIRKSSSKISWLSHHFKCSQFPTAIKMRCPPAS